MVKFKSISFIYLVQCIKKKLKKADLVQLKRTLGVIVHPETNENIKGLRGQNLGIPSYGENPQGRRRKNWEYKKN